MSLTDFRRLADTAAAEYAAVPGDIVWDVGDGAVGGGGGGRLGGEAVGQGGYSGQRDGTWTRRKADGTKRVLAFREHTPTLSFLVSDEACLASTLFPVLPGVSLFFGETAFPLICTLHRIFFFFFSCGNRLSFLSNLCVFHHTMWVVLQY